MKFCPKCKSIMMPKKINNKKVLACKCGYKENSKDLKISEKKEKETRSFEVVGEEEEHTLPTTEAECDKCGNREAYYYAVQTRSGDEPETKFLICTKCKHKWRDYS